MLTQLHIQNFKSWHDTGQLRFAPLTGFFGPNSSGKTSILQFLLMLKQTVESNQRSQVLELGSNPAGRGFYVNLGTFTDIVTQKEIPGKISFEFAWNSEEKIDHNFDERAERIHAAKAIAFAAEIAQDADNIPRVNHFFYKLNQTRVGAKRIETPITQNVHYQLLCNSADSDDVKNSAEDIFFNTVFKCYGFPPNLQDVMIADQSLTLSDLNSEFEACFYSIKYLGPLREYPNRSYLWGGSPVDDVGIRGEQTIQALLHASGYPQNPIDYVNGVQTDTEYHVAKWLKALNLIYSFKLCPITEGRPEYEVKVRQTEKSPEVLLTEVGFGISQILPVLTLCYYVPRASTIILEQPEIHLHPAIQAGLADVFIDVIKNRGVQIILESHSEHLLRRLQRRIAEEHLVLADVALYFTQMENGESKVEQLKVDEYGSINNWPQNFFGDEMGDLVAMTEAAMQRQGVME